MIDDTLSRVPIVHAEIARTERFVPIVMSLHAVLVTLYGKNISFSLSAVWVISLVVFSVSMWLLIRQDQQRRFVLFRALYLAAVIWVITLLSGGTNSLFVFWNLAISVIYPPQLSRRHGLVLMTVVAISYLLLFPLTPDGLSFVLVVVRTATIFFAGWTTYNLNMRIIKAVIEHQELKQRLVNAEIVQQKLENEAQFYQQKMDFIALVSHEFRTPMAIIETANSLLMRYYERMTPEMRIKRLAEIQDQTAHLADMLHTISTAEKLFTLPTTTIPSALNLQQHCEEIVEELQWLDNQRHPINDTYECASDKVTLDRARLNVILYHLLSNAIKYSPENTDIDLHVSCSAQEITLKVIDRGMGIDEVNRPHLFQPFYRSENVAFIKGIGLGLALVYESVQQQGGSIDWTSEVGTGTTFEVHLPLKRLS
jgi:signal transduction histidine kinase